MNINKCKIRLAKEPDLQGILDLVKELAEYEKAAVQVATTLEVYRKNYKEGLFEAIVAEDETENKIIGMALYYPTFSTWKGKMIYLEDFIVTEKYRRKHIGQAIFDKFLEISKQKEAKLVKLQVLDWNEPAISFYKKNKMIIEDDWWNVKIIFSDEV